MHLNIKYIYFFLRIAAAGSKYLLIIYLSTIPDETLLGKFGYQQAIIIYFIYLFGLEFYVHASRSVWGKFQNKRGLLIKSQIIVYSWSYIIFLPVLFFVMKQSEYSLALILALCSLSVVEHISQEACRYLVFTNRQVASGLIIFARSALWIIAFITLTYYNFMVLTNELLLLFWIFGNIISVILFLCFLKNSDFVGFFLKYDRDWVFSFKKTFIYILLSSLVMRAFFALDKVYIENFFDAAELSKYVFYFACVNLMLLAAEALVTNFKLPVMLRLVEEKSYNQLQKVINDFWIKILFTGSIFSFSIYIFVTVIGKFIDQGFEQDFIILCLCILTGFVMIVTSIPHYGLFVLKKDMDLFIINLLGLCICMIGFTIGYKFNLGLWSVLASIINAFILMGIIKAYRLNLKFQKILKSHDGEINVFKK